MKLTTAQIEAAARGVAYITEEDGCVRLHRFTAQQEELYRQTNSEHYDRSFATAGVILEFDTDSETLNLAIRARKGSSRHWLVHSIFVNGQRIGQLTGTYQPPQTVDAGAGWYLGKGEKRVKICFPWSAGSMVKSLELEDGAAFRPVTKAKRVLIFGDSITQGYDAALPENAYASILADALDGDCINKAIGGEVFRPELAALRDAGEFDLITVAYGTNDWSGKTPDVLAANARGFYTQLRQNYPDTKIVVLAPIWRQSWQEKRPGGDFRQVAAVLRKIAEEIGNTLFVDCFDFVPKDPENFSPDVLHPNDQGFRHYAKAILDVLKKENLLK